MAIELPGHLRVAQRQLGHGVGEQAAPLALSAHHGGHEVVEEIADALEPRARIGDHVEGAARAEYYRDQRKGRPDAQHDAFFEESADERDFTHGLEVRELLARMPRAALEPLVLQAVVGLSCEEIAQVLGVSVAAAMTRISRARAAMQRRIYEPPDASRVATGGE